jgi:2-polyprenyl-3-methyl-5-hydroxy-6-metoxy-1,4-benzoquinol methylase
MDLTEIKECLACGHDHLIPVLNLNDQPLANSYKKTKDEPEASYPLKINRCNYCYHVQLSHAVNPDLIYKNYLYVSGTTKTYVEYMEWYADFCIETFGHNPSSVLDIGCNDGSQLNAFKSRGLSTYGVDPAENLYSISSQNHNVKCGYFDKNYQLDENYQQYADIITIQNAFAHNPNPREFLKNCKRNLKPGGLIFIQTSQSDMILNNEFDTIYHEHISFYNILSMSLLCIRAGLELIDVVKTPIHGTSYIFIISADKKAEARVNNLIGMENFAGLYDRITYVDYAQNCIDMVDKFKEKVEYWRSQGYKVVGYGAAAKANTFLNFSKVPFDMIIDDNPLKQGLYTPGSSVGIVSSDVLKTFTKDDKILFVPLAWNFFKEIRERIIAKRNNFNDIFLDMKDL